jgi:MinD-like ATPase involved in chromosome partitioning or flagellar assembly
MQPGEGLISVLEGYATVPDVIYKAQIGNFPLLVLPSVSAAGSAEWMASRAMSAVLQDFRRDYRSRIVILDMPPVLSSDDVIAILPQIDCVLLVAAAGISTPDEIQDCGKHLQSADVVRVVVNKTSEPSKAYGVKY